MKLLFPTLAALCGILACNAPASAQELSPGSVVGTFVRAGRAIDIRAERATVRLEFYAPDMVRVRTSFSRRFADDETIMVAKHDWPDVAVAASDGADHMTFSTARLTVEVGRSPLRLTYLLTGGRPLTADDPRPGGGVTTRDGVVRSRMRLDATEQFYGFGERMDRFTWRGHSVTLDVGRGSNPNHELGAYNIALANYCPVPFFMSTAGYGLFFHTDRATTWDMGESSPGSYQFSAPAPEMDYYLIAGPAFKSILGRYTELTGRTPLLPKAAYGTNFGTYSGGTWGHEEQATQAYVVALARRFRDEKIPADVLHLDSTWRRFGTAGGRNATSFEWRMPGFPDGAAMFRALRDLHFSLVGLHVRPRLDNGDTTSLLDEARAAGAIAATPTANIVNFFDPKAVEWWWRHAVAPKAAEGAGFLKTDEGSIYPGEGLHNLFPVVYARAAYESFQANLGRRGFTLTREGYAGVQRYPYIWAGDWPSRWTFFGPVVRGGLNLALSGVSAWGHNAGGFEEVATEELYLRWTPIGFFNPVAHFLGMEHPQYKEPWQYGPRALAAFRRYAQVRYRLMPYIYTSAYDAYATGVPVMRPLVLEYPDDPLVREVDDEYLFGEWLLVAPVTKEGATGRRVVLPKGTWFDYWTGQRYDGGQTFEFPAAADVLPVFAKAGAVIPLQPDMAYVDEKPVDPLIVEVYPSGQSRYVLYEDDGASLAYQRGAFARTTLTCSASPNAIEMRAEAPSGPHPVAPRAVEFLVHLDRPPRAVTVNGAPATAHYDAATRTLRVPVPRPARPSAVTVRVDR